MRRKSTLYLGIIALALIGTLTLCYQSFFSTTKIALVNFPDFTIEKFIRANQNPWIELVPTRSTEMSKIKSCDMALIRVHGDNLSHQEAKALEEAMNDGLPLLTSDPNQEKLSSFIGKEKEYLSLLINNGCTKNYQSFFNYIRTHVDKKKCGNETYKEPIQIPSDYFFYLGDDNFFATYKAYQTFYEKTGHYKKGGPRIAILAGNINKQNANEEPMAALIHHLENLGNNVYPIYSFGKKKLEMIQALKPNLILNHPHGRLIMGDAEAGIAALKKIGVPILSPQTVYTDYGQWLKSKQGMGAGGLTTMSVVLPEMDGAIAPFAVAAQFEKNGRKLFNAIPKHTEKFCHLANNFIQLQRKKNKDKHIAIYFYKGVGKGCINAADIEGVQSLYNTLCNLRDNGYNVSGLPNSAKELEAMIQQQAPVLGAYALGAYDEFLKKGHPSLVDVDTFQKWADASLPDSLQQAMINTYGEAPGKYMQVEKEGKKYIAVAKVQLGNIALLPQPLPAVGDDTNKIIHGVDQAPTYPYVASYCWTRNQFKADAIVHFGTHGSLEFIPGKAITPSSYDWTDALISDMPHFYIYAISDVGEGIIAKRRSYATLLSHLTPPFMKSELYDELEILQNTIHKMENMHEGDIKRTYRKKISTLAKSQNILQTLQLDSTRTLNDEEINQIHRYLEEINSSKVNEGLYTLGKSYTTKQLNNTTRMMNLDPVRYALANLDVIHGKVKQKQLDDIGFIAHRYDAKTRRIIQRALQTQGNIASIMRTLITPKEAQKLTKHEQFIAQKKARRKRMMAMMSRSKGTAPVSMMHAMNAAKPVGVNKSPISATEKKQAKEQAHIEALVQLKKAITQIASTKDLLRACTRMEQESLIHALNGRYIPAGSAGDPILNPNAIPTGKNYYSINPETTPSDAAWRVGKTLADQLLAKELKEKGKYPEKVSFTLWSSDFINSEGASIAEILYLLGVEPMRDGFGYIRSLRLMPAQSLGRPRIDVVVQTSGQLRDIAASRLKLINDAIAMAVKAEDGAENNYVRKGFEDAEKHLLNKGFSPLEARKYAKERIFGGANNNYGTGITGKVMQGDKWEKRSELADEYLHNMGALYTDNGGEHWGEMREGVFEAALLNTSVIVHPLSSNTWGALSLDHVYEFMGGLSAAVERVTGNDATGYFNDYRNSAHAGVKGLKEAIGIESNSTVLNPKYIRAMLQGEASAMNTFTEVITNTYGWNSLKPSAIDQHLWNRYYDVYVKDQYHLNLTKTFEQKNPYALQELTAVMLEIARKGMWQATPTQLAEVAKLHTTLVQKHQAACSGFVCDNAKLRKYIAEKVAPEQAKTYKESIKKAREVNIDAKQSKKSVVLKKEEQATNPTQEKAKATAATQKTSYTTLYVIGAVFFIGLLWFILRKKQED